MKRTSNYIFIKAPKGWEDTEKLKQVIKLFNPELLEHYIIEVLEEKTSPQCPSLVTVKVITTCWDGISKTEHTTIKAVWEKREKERILYGMRASAFDNGITFSKQITRSYKGEYYEISNYYL